MHINNDIIFNYFDCKLEWKLDIPKFTITLKNEYKMGKSHPFRPNSKIPYSGIEKEYYTYYLGDTELANNVFVERKKLVSKHAQLKWWMGVVELDDKIIDDIEKYLYNIGKNISDKLNSHYNSEAGHVTKQKLKTRSEKWAPIIGKINSDKWKDNNWRETEMRRRTETGFYEKVADKNRKRMQDAEYHRKFMRSMNDVGRLNLISKSSKKMWERMRRDKPDAYYRIINSGPNKNFILNGYNMNRVEYLMGSLLNDIGMEWEYEKDFDFNGKVYVPDFYISDCKLVIECYGDYWHANPNIYTTGDIIFNHIMVEDIWNRDVVRMNAFIQSGYSFLPIWESDIKNNIKKVKDTICRNI